MDRTPSFVVQFFGNYILLDRIAVGGMAEIFKAKQSGARGFEKIVVIKKILQHLSEDPEFVSMFEDEAKIAAQLNQANIVQIYELGEVNDVLYIVMEYVEGKNLRDLNRALQAKNLHLSIEQSLYIMSGVLKGLDYAHRKTDSMGVPLEIIHRDMSPQNIVISYEGEVKILDFGIAKAASKISQTEAGVLKGKFSYMSPEQASGRSVEQTTDIYAAGVILHELLTSQRLFRAETDMETLERVRQGVVPKPSEKNPLVPPELDRIVLKALARDEEKRYQTAGEFFSDIVDFVSKSRLSFSSQQLASFMKTVFEENIALERTRLQLALAEKPLEDLSANKNVKTHIAFKSEQLSTPPAQQDPEITYVSQVTRTGGSLFFRFAIATFFIFALIAFLWSMRFDESPSPQPEAPLTESEVEQERPAPKDPEPQAEPQVPPMIQNELAPEENAIENILDSVQPPPIQRAPPAPAPAPKAKSYGIIDVIAPFEGYAQLFINSELIGGVPGPKARGIRLEKGTHKIRCETSTRIYEGEFELKANSRLSIRCQELPEKSR